jgi:hypothetical protein
MPNKLSSCLVLFALVVSSASLTLARAQSVAGTWEGLAGGGRLSVTLDSSAAGWRGSLFAPGFHADTIRLTAVIVGRDSVEMRLPAEFMGAVLRGALSPDRRRLGGYAIVSNDSSGAFRLARSGTQEAAQLLGLSAAATAGSPPRRPHADPDSARLITSDITLFWDVFSRATPDSLEALLQREYLDRGTPGLRDFIPGRIQSAADLALRVTRSRQRYESRREATLRVAEAEPGIRAAYRSLKTIYPDAVYPDVYFLIGRFNSGGTASPNGLLIGAEMFSDPARLPAIVAHELIHFQQVRGGSRTLLAQSFVEGAADLVGEMISGVHINSTAHQYGRAHERELWPEFKEKMGGTSYTGWMYGDPPGERPADLGYFIGYRIAQAYYNSATDKPSALRDIIRSADVEAILAKSGYQP